MSATLSDAMDEYLASRKARGIAKSTVVNERTVLRQMLTVNGNILCKNITGRHIDAYFTGYPHLSSGTWNRNIGYLQSFFKWCRARKYMGKDHDPLEGVGTRKVEPRDFILIPSARFDEALDAARHGRDRAVLAIGLYSLQRASEISRLLWSDLDDTSPDPRQWRINTYRQKTGTRDELPLPVELRDELQRWRLEYGAMVGEVPHADWYITPAFKPGEWGQGPDGRLRLKSPLKLDPTRRYRRAEQAVHAALTRMGFSEEAQKQEGAHTLRRSGGRALYEELAWQRGHDDVMDTIRSMYGHKNIATTERYLRLTTDRKRRNDLLAGRVMFPKRDAEVVELGTGNGHSAAM